jgi:hypothetical protein
LHRHNKETGRLGAAGAKSNDIGRHSIAHQPPDGKALATYIRDNHIESLGSAWELALVQALARYQGPLAEHQLKVLQSIWRKIQGEVRS